MKKCYICFTETENKSNCVCKSYICKECLIKEVEYRNWKCSICKKNIEDIEIFILEINKKKVKKNNIELAKYIFYIFLILFFIFVTGNLYLNFISKSFKVYFNGTVFIYGFLFYILTLFITILLLYSGSILGVLIAYMVVLT